MIVLSVDFATWWIDRFAPVGQKITACEEAFGGDTVGTLSLEFTAMAMAGETSYDAEVGFLKEARQAMTATLALSDNKGIAIRRRLPVRPRWGLRTMREATSDVQRNHPAYLYSWRSLS